MDAVELIAQAIDDLNYRPPEGYRVAPDYSNRELLLIGALEAFYGAGACDEQAGDVETVGHFARVDRFILRTDSAGFLSVEEHGTAYAAETRMTQVDAEAIGDGDA